MSCDTCPGHRRCYALQGVEPCRVHGCRVCGACILADTEDWPAPLCIVHAPEELIDYVGQARRALLGLVDYFDGVHAGDCAVARTGPASDETIKGNIRDGVSSCSCGAFAVRQGARIHFNLEGEDSPRPKRDTDRAPPPAPASTPAGLVQALERTLGGRVVLVETSWGGPKGRVN